MKEAFEKLGWCVLNIDGEHFTVENFQKDFYISVLLNMGKKKILILIFDISYDVLRALYTLS
jgi:hypothetical protein